MQKEDRIKRHINNYLYDHIHLRRALINGKGLFYALISAFVFAFGFTTFITPVGDGVTVPAFNLVTGGVSGLSQNVAKIVELCGGKLTDTTITAIGYAAFNVPLIIFAFFKIGKRFSILTAVNVIASALFINFFPIWGFTTEIASNEIIAQHGTVFRVLFGGVCTGVSSAIAFRGEISCGGMDIVTYYFSLRKSTSVGKYSIALNGIIVALYSVLIIINDPTQWSDAIISMFLSASYLFVCSIIIDLINLRNKKVQLQFVTTDDNLAKILIAEFPHSATITKAKGVYSDNDKIIIFMVVSSYEVKKVVEAAKRVDRSVFITATSLVQVYGHFFIRPVE